MLQVVDEKLNLEYNSQRIILGKSDMTIQEFGQVLITLLIEVLKGIGEIMRCIGDVIINNAKAPNLKVPTNTIKLFSNITVNRIIFFAVIAYILFINILTFLSFKNDKERAKRKDRRISESSLLIRCFIGGAIGGMLGISTVRHKTKKKSFTVTVTVLLVIQLILYCFVLGFLSFWTFF